jgi:hypothetical protein
MKQPSGRFMMCVLVFTMGLIGDRSGAFAQANPAQAPTQTQTSKPGQTPKTASATQRSAASNTTKAITNSQTPAKPAAAPATANSSNPPSAAGLIAPPGWTPPAQTQAATGQKTAAMPTKKTVSAASRPATKQKDKAGNADSH